MVYIKCIRTSEPAHFVDILERIKMYSLYLFLEYRTKWKIKAECYTDHMSK